MSPDIRVSEIVGDLTQLNSCAEHYPIDLGLLNRRMQEIHGNVRLCFNFELSGPDQPPLELLVAQPVEDCQCLVAVAPDIKIFFEHARDLFNPRPMRVTIISDDAAIRAWVRGFRKLGMGLESVYSADIDRHLNGRNGTWGYDLIRAMVVPPDSTGL